MGQAKAGLGGPHASTGRGWRRRGAGGASGAPVVALVAHGRVVASAPSAWPHRGPASLRATRGPEFRPHFHVLDMGIYSYNYMDFSFHTARSVNIINYYHIVIANYTLSLFSFPNSNDQLSKATGKKAYFCELHLRLLLSSYFTESVIFDLN
nr:hypothetical protein Iba_chr07cCG8230 [Ipomoea batatas]